MVLYPLATGKYGCTEVRVFRGTGVSRRVRQTHWERSLKNCELQISCFEEFWVERTFWDSSLLVSLTLWDTLVLFTPPLPVPLNPAHLGPVVPDPSFLTFVEFLAFFPLRSRFCLLFSGF